MVKNSDHLSAPSTRLAIGNVTLFHLSTALPGPNGDHAPGFERSNDRNDEPVYFAVQLERGINAPSLRSGPRGAGPLAEERFTAVETLATPVIHELMEYFSSVLD